MAISIYQCDHCHFTFERAGEVDNCPDCGNIGVRHATETEQAEYRKIKAELVAARNGSAGR